MNYLPAESMRKMFEEEALGFLQRLAINGFLL